MSVGDRPSFLRGVTRRRAFLLALLSAASIAVPVWKASAADYQIIDVQPGETVDVYFEINLSGQLILRIATQAGPGCAELWWITWPLGSINSLGKKCGSVQLNIPGWFDLAMSAKLRAAGVDAPTKIVAASSEQVANFVTLHW